ncbi:MAG: ATP-binding protein [bacterium]|nr:ATP-binding protein [bacterium]
MSDKRNPVEVIKDISLLYELSLSVGRSLNLRTECDVFLKTLMARKDLAYSSVWIKNEYLPDEEDKGYATLVYANPEFRIKNTCIPLSHPLFTKLKDKEFLSLASSDDDFSGLITEKGIDKGVFTIFTLGNIGLLKIFSVTRKTSFEERELNQLRDVVSKFTISLEGCLLHKRVIREITERKQAEEDLVKYRRHLEELVKERTEALEVEKERLAVTLASIGDGVIATDTKGKIGLINKVAEGLTGWRQKEAVGKPLAEVFHIINEQTRERGEDPVRKVLEAGKAVGLINNTALIARDGTERALANSGAPIRKDSNIIGVVLVFRDITEKRKMEEELVKIQKLESIGILAGGIAHDFNNILTAILGNISLAKMYGKPEDKGFDKLTLAENASLRAKDLTGQLLAFARGGAPIKRPASIAELLKDTAGFILSGSNVKYQFSISDSLWPIECDVRQISQVINNLILNARDAMPEGGIIKVKAENIIVEAQSALPLQEGNYLKISIQDQGSGISKEILPKIFDPFFSTKHKRSGLGLAVSFAVIKRHQGYIYVTSKVGIGTTFDIYLPATEVGITIKEKETDEIVRGEGKILLMDDEEDIRKVTSGLLKAVGYEVDFAKDGAEAIEIYKKAKESAQPFKAVILDLTVPGSVGGRVAIRELIEFDPEVKAIVSSGYSTDPIMAGFREYGFSGVVVKPYKITELSQILHRVIIGDR